jgi:prephenate dehydrogenase
MRDRQVLIVGYKGEIGSFILNGLLRVMPKALDIWCVDVNETEGETVERIKIADVIFLCVPIDVTLEWLVTYKMLLSKKMLLEQCSLKELVYKSKDIEDLDIRSMYILFRPSSISFDL